MRPTARYATFLLVLSFLFVPPVSAATDDREAVRLVVLDYFEGWFTGDAERFLGALHPELAKRIPRQRDGSWSLHSSDREEMADYVRSGRSVRKLEVADVQVEVYDVRDGVATAMGSCNTFFDYVHLARLDGEWKIVNVLWQQRPDED